MKEKNRTLIILHIAVFLAGWTGIFGRMISLGGLPLVWYRMLVSIVTLVLVLALTRRLHKVGWKSVAQIAGCGVLLALHWVAFFASIQTANVSVGVACIATSCFFTTLFEPLINRTRVSWKEILISFISIAGVLLIFSLDVRYRLGIALSLLSAALYSIFAIFNVNVAARTGQDTPTMLLWELIGGALFLTLCIPLRARLAPAGPIFPAGTILPAGNDWIWLLLLGSVFTIVPFLFQLHALRKLSAFTVNLTYNLEPVYSIVLAALLFHETREVGWSFWLGLTLIIISVLLQTRRISRRAV
ncbi:MAG: EamA family transporter [Bacteroidales bacterium]|nr:EamA family transporter [Bacteroidales bacterium]